MRLFRAGPVAAFILGLALLQPVLGQTATLTGRVTDQSGAFVPRARVVASSPWGKPTTAMAGEDGVYAMNGLAPGDYSIAAATARSLSMQPISTTLKAGPQILDLRLNVAAVATQIDVGDVAGSVNVESNSNTLRNRTQG